jgi:hypothetical protein
MRRPSPRGIAAKMPVNPIEAANAGQAAVVRVEFSGVFGSIYANRYCCSYISWWAVASHGGLLPCNVPIEGEANHARD